jgi:ABC-2 type transport system ATP-binding protein
MQTPSEVLALSEPNHIVLRTEKLTRAFGTVRAVDEVALELRRGEIYGFLGRNGAGKTTTLRLLCGILRPHFGIIELLGERLTRVRAAHRRRLGYVAQEQTFYPWMSARQLGQFVAGFYPSWSNASFEAHLRALDVPPDRKAAQLSGGMRMKLAIALALAHKPELLLLDEPTTGLDPVARHEVTELLRERARQDGQSILLSSHLVSELEPIADRIGILNQGRLSHQGPLSDLTASFRRLIVTADDPPPELLSQGGIRVLRRDSLMNGQNAYVLEALPDSWPASEPRLERMSLSEIFLAIARTKRA